MSETNALRFEFTGTKKNLQSALRRQEERVKNDELMAAREFEAKQEIASALKSKWTQDFEKVAQRQKRINSEKTLQNEIVLAQRTALKVRREALRYQLENEYREQEQELHKIGKTFYIQRR